MSLKSKKINCIILIAYIIGQNEYKILVLIFSYKMNLLICFYVCISETGFRIHKIREVINWSALKSF